MSLKRKDEKEHEKSAMTTTTTKTTSPLSSAVMCPVAIGPELSAFLKDVNLRGVTAHSKIHAIDTKHHSTAVTTFLIAATRIAALGSEVPYGDKDMDALHDSNLAIKRQWKDYPLCYLWGNADKCEHSFGILFKTPKTDPLVTLLIMARRMAVRESSGLKHWSALHKDVRMQKQKLWFDYIVTKLLTTDEQRYAYMEFMNIGTCPVGLFQYEDQIDEGYDLLPAARELKLRPELTAPAADSVDASLTTSSTTTDISADSATSK